jgi:hypothetical protein
MSHRWPMMLKQGKSNLRDLNTGEVTESCLGTSSFGKENGIDVMIDSSTLLALKRVLGISRDLLLNSRSWDCESRLINNRRLIT